jgi:polysaccharide biosynthesis transport protein
MTVSINELIPREHSEIPDATALLPLQSATQRSFGLRNFLRVIVRRRYWIIGTVVAACALAFAISVFMKPIYQANTIIELNKNNSGGLDVDLGQALSQTFGGSSESLQTDLATETTILEGDSLALAVIQKLNLADSPEFRASGKAARLEAAEKGLPIEKAPMTRSRLLKLFHDRLAVTPIHGTRLIKVSYEMPDTNLAAAIANSLIDSYKAQYLKSHYDATSEVSEWLTGQLSDLKANVQESEKELADFERKTGILSLGMMTPSTSDQSETGAGGVHSVVIEKLDALNAELTAAEANRIQKEAIYRLAASSSGDALIALASSPGTAQLSSPALSEIAVLQQLRVQQNSLNMTLAQDSVAMGKNNRHVRELETQIAEGERQIQGEMQRVTHLAGSDLELAKETEQQLRRQFDQQQAAASKLNEDTIEFAVLREEAFSRKKLYEDLYTRLQEANVAAGIKATNITVIDPARSAARPIRPAKATNVATGFSLGLLGGLLLAFTVDRLDNTVVTALEVEEITAEPVLGVIPTFGYGAGRSRGAYGVPGLRKRSPTPEAKELGPESLWMLNNPDSPAAEAFRSLRTAILLARAGGGIKIILVTGCVPGEGKSTVTGNLAVSFAQHGKRVIVIEADMRRPTMKHIMGVSNEAGLSNVLTGSRTLDEVLLSGVHLPTLDVLPAGQRPPMPSEILDSVAFDDLLADLSCRYDIVIIDSPPALVVTDSISIASKSDATVLVVRAGTVTRPQLARVAQLIERNRLPVIGFVLNRMDRSLDPYGYDYEYAYGYDHKKYDSYYGGKSDEA